MISLVLVLVLFVACSSDDNELEKKVSDVGTEEYEGLWKLVEGIGPEGKVPVVKGWDVTGHITAERLFGDDGAIFGDTGCNYYMQRIKIIGTRLSFGNGGYINEMGCGSIAPEDSYMAALYDTTEIGRDGERLVLSGPESRLVFETVPAPPVEEMVQQRWQLRKLIRTHPRTRVVPVRAEFRLHKGGSFEATAGCIRLRGKWIEEGDRIMFTESSSGGHCGQDALERYAGWVGEALGDGFSARVRGSKLTIFAARSRDRLLYRAAP